MVFLAGAADGLAVSVGFESRLPIREGKDLGGIVFNMRGMQNKQAHP